MEKEKKIYLYETHMHTKEGSACAHNTGAEMAMEFLIKQGHRRIGYIHGINNIDDKERFQAYLDVFEQKLANFLLHILLFHLQQFCTNHF